jgi:hypothetical protein
MPPTHSRPGPLLFSIAATLALIVGGCATTLPPIRFAPPGTDVAKLRSDFPLTDAERLALTPESVRRLTQEQVDQIYLRLWSGAIPDGPFRGDLFFPRDRDGHARIRDLAEPAALPLLAHVATLRAESLGRLFWRGKAFFRSQMILRNRIDELTLLKPFIDSPETIPKMSFDGETTWLLFPAIVSCGTSRLDPTRPSTVIDYSRGKEVEGYRDIPDRLAGPERLNIRDEVRIVRRGFYLGRAYFGQRFALNFTLLDPTIAPPTPPLTGIEEDCHAAPAGGKAPSAHDRAHDRGARGPRDRRLLVASRP